MNVHDLRSNIYVTPAVAIETLSGTTPGTAIAIDRQGYSSVTLVVGTGAITDAGTAAGIVWELTESDASDSGYTAVGDGDLIGTEAGLSILLDTDDNKIIGTLGYKGNKRYLKLTPTGSTGTDGTVYAICILGGAVINPANN